MSTARRAGSYRGNSSSFILRRLLPLMVVIALATGWLRFLATETGLGRSSRRNRRSTDRGSASRPCTGSWRRAAATSGSTPSPVAARRSRSTYRWRSLRSHGRWDRRRRCRGGRVRRRHRSRRRGPSRRSRVDRAGPARRRLRRRGGVVGRRGPGRPEQDVVDVVLTDLVMPGGTGERLAGCVDERGSTPNLVFMSGYTEASITRDDLLTDGGGLPREAVHARPPARRRRRRRARAARGCPSSV